MFLHDLATGTNELTLGVDVDGCNMSILLCADDNLFIAPIENNLQLDYVKDWCKNGECQLTKTKLKLSI